MAQKKGGGKGGVSEDADELARSPLQAILLADTFNLKFRPITLERPKVLLPLVNTPMIEYTLTWLESVRVEEVFVFCCSHSDQVKNYIKNSHWSKHSATFSIHCIESNFSISAGDALRFIEAKNIIRGDFILITGDTITNTSLTEALNLHKERRKKDPDTIMTMLVKRSKPLDLTRQTRLGTDEILMGINPETKQLLLYEEEKGDFNFKKVLNIDKEIVKENSLISLRNDLEDCYIDICSPEMLTILLDNFDYQHLRKHFVKGLLLDDIMGKKIYTHEITSSYYAARVDNFRSYDVISKDIIQRWPFPLVPDVIYVGNKHKVRLQRNGLYKAPDVILSSSSSIGPNSSIGSSTSIGSNSQISNSIIGESCQIGKNVIIQGSYIWDDVIIEDNCTLTNAVVCDGVCLRSGVVLEPGVILSFKVEVGQNIKIPAYSKVSLLPQPSKQDSDEELEYADSTTGVINSPSIASISPKNVEASFETESQEAGISGVGFIWTYSETETEEEHWRYSVAPIPAQKLRELREFAINNSDAILEDEEERSNFTHSGEIVPDGKSGYDSEGEYRGDSYKFEKEVEETFERALGGVAEENVKLEINSLRLSYNVAHSECAGALFQSVIKSALIISSQSSSGVLLKSTVEAIERWKGLLFHFIRTVDEEIEVILKFEEMCMETTKDFSPIFSSVLHQLYDKDVISEESILSWASEKDGADESDKIFVKQCDAFIKWLKEAPEEDDEDE